jgi:hypothetical protein
MGTNLEKRGEREEIGLACSRLVPVVAGKDDEHEPMKKGWENCTVRVGPWLAGTPTQLFRFGSSVPPTYTLQPGVPPLSQPDRACEN